MRRGPSSSWASSFISSPIPAARRGHGLVGSGGTGMVQMAEVVVKDGAVGVALRESSQGFQYQKPAAVLNWCSLFAVSVWSAISIFATHPSTFRPPQF